MNSVIHFDNEAKSTPHNPHEEFKKEVLSGLSLPHKKISSKFFYDQQGSHLFNQITRHPDYYLTQCELSIIKTYKKQIADYLKDQPFNLIELGPGEGIKTQLLIEEFLDDSLIFSYIPIDISASYLEQLNTEFDRKLPALKVTALHADYFQGLQWLSLTSGQRNVVLFLGSSIGNFDVKATEEFFHHLWQVLHHDDYVIIGFDLRKDIDILMRAYNDRDGLTRDFNLNLFRRINRELGANFAIDELQHYGTYNVYTGAMESYVVSLAEQVVEISALNSSIILQQFEPIHVEYSYKYTLSQIETLAQITGFEIVKNFADSKAYFIDSLWRVNKIR
jgi:L-histidine N-alpha-methyltransferase